MKKQTQTKTKTQLESCGPRTEIWSAYVEDEEISIVATKPIYIRCSFKHWNETCLIFLYKKVEKQWTNFSTIYHSKERTYIFQQISREKIEKYSIFLINNMDIFLNIFMTNNIYKGSN